MVTVQCELETQSMVMRQCTGGAGEDAGPTCDVLHGGVRAWQRGGPLQSVWPVVGGPVRHGVRRGGLRRAPAAVTPAWGERTLHHWPDPTKQYRATEDPYSIVVDCSFVRGFGL